VGRVGPLVAMLNILDLHTYYGDSHVLQGVTMRVDKRAVTAVLGRNGVGKTTLCRSIFGLTPARAGRIVFDGAEITRLPPHRICGMRISLVPQGRRIFPSLTVEENLAIAARMHVSFAGARGSWDVQKVHAVFPRLAERQGHRGNELSGGEQQMLAIARALVANPVLLVMDEPTEGLAPMLVAEVGTLIRRLKDEGTSVLLVEQNAAFAVKTADYVHVMSKGQVVPTSEPAALWANQDIKTQFLGVPRAAGTPPPAQNSP
jgi:branched-chain amino acid transport system ATP-binding protein